MSRPRSRASSPRAGRSTTATTAGGRRGSATSRSSSRRARRCRSWRTRSKPSGIAYRAEASSLVYATRAVRDLLMVLRAVDDPTNQLHLVAALRTPLLGCGDDDLFRFKVERRGRGATSPTSPTPCPTTIRCGRASPTCARLHDQRHWDAPSELLDRIARDRRAFELGLRRGPPADVWRRLRFVIDQARAWSEATGGEPARSTCAGSSSSRPRAHGCGVGPARDRRRRGADHDHPRGQGPRVPDHDRVGHVDRAAAARRARRGGVPARRARSGTSSGSASDRRVRRLEAHRRADGLRRADPAALRRVHPRA